MYGSGEESVEMAVALAVAVDGGLPGMIGQLIEGKNKFQSITDLRCNLESGLRATVGIDGDAIVDLKHGL